MIKKIWQHLKNGTLLEAFRGRFRAIKHRRKMKEWNSLTQGKEYIPYTFDNDIHLNLYSDSILCRVIYEGHFETEELTYYKRYIKEGDVILDIGSNIGLHALYASKLAGIKGQVYAFEPVRKTYTRFVENIELNRFKNIKHFQLAISDESGEAEITTSTDGHDAWNSMAVPSNEEQKNSIREKIRTETLDHFISMNLGATKIDFIKIDTEGWELNVLKGGENYLKNNDPIIMVEYAVDIAKNFNRNLEDIYDILTKYGFKLYKYNHLKDSFRIVERHEKLVEANVFASKRVLDKSI
jgi:FkbM family methyltransferase